MQEGHIYLVPARYADARVDFDGASLSDDTASSYAGGLLRLRTAHASLSWDHTEAFFSLDHVHRRAQHANVTHCSCSFGTCMVGQSVDVEPAGGLTQHFSSSNFATIRLQGALIDVMNAPQIYGLLHRQRDIVPPTTAEMSRWPGAEGRVASSTLQTKPDFRSGLVASMPPITHRGGHASIRGPAPSTIGFRFQVMGIERQRLLGAGPGGSWVEELQGLRLSLESAFAVWLFIPYA